VTTASLLKSAASRANDAPDAALAGSARVRFRLAAHATRTGRGERLLDLVDQLLVQVDEAAEEVNHELQVLLPVRQACRTLLGFIEALAEVVDVFAQRGEAVARDLFADEVADEQPQERLALEWCDPGGRARVRWQLLFNNSLDNLIT
jgi:hypothetical protein